MHCLGFRLDDTDAVVSAGQTAATVKGTVSELGDGSSGVTGMPVLTNIEILSSDETCEEATIPHLCVEPSAVDQAPSPATPPTSHATNISSSVLGLTGIFIFDTKLCSAVFPRNKAFRRERAAHQFCPQKFQSCTVERYTA
eukprot:scaffold39508_cov72-Cyclotella_meneghiniana.AAC.1